LGRPPARSLILDTALERASTAVQVRFQMLLAGAGTAPSWDSSQPVPPAWDYETWTDDLDRAVAALSRQDFAVGIRLLERWLGSFPAGQLDTRGLYLHARSLVLLGDAHRDQGRLEGPLSATQAYRRALAMFSDLDVPRRVAQIELSLTVVGEMSGQLQLAARRYAGLADDERLSGRDRARARLWIGTALSKDGEHDYATRIMAAAAREFEDLGEAEDWSVAQQKLALAYRGAGNLGQAQKFIDVARASGVGDTPMQRVRWSTAQAHILLADTATRARGLALLDETARLAVQCGLSHQLRSIETIRRDMAHAAGTGKGTM
jgi:tetratricopeptide (TPR) repeat protein